MKRDTRYDRGAAQSYFSEAPRLLRGSIDACYHKGMPFFGYFFFLHDLHDRAPSPNVVDRFSKIAPRPAPKKKKKKQ